MFEHKANINGRSLKLCVFLTDPMRIYYKKGEIKTMYYNPRDVFNEVHMISFCRKDINPDVIKEVAGSAKLFIHSVGNINIFFLPFTIIKISYLIKKISPDIIRAYDPSLRGVIAVLCGKKFGIKTVISLHANLDEQRIFRKEFKFKIRKFLERFSLSNASKVICVTDYLVSYARRNGAKDITVIYNRVDIKRFSNDRKRDGNTVKEILCVARLDSQKYQECLIKALKSLDMHLTLIGSGKMEKYLKKLVTELGVSNKIRFIDSVANKEISIYYNMADIFAIATHYEGFCIPLIEAMASGLPIVASDILPIREVLGDAGILLENKPEVFSDTFRRLRDDKNLYKSLSQAGKRRVLTFDSEIIENKEKGLYLKCVN